MAQVTAQDIFDMVAQHLLTQNKQAQDEVGDCQYRTDDGLMCAVGCLINEDEYSPQYEGCSCDHEDVIEAVERSLGIEISVEGHVYNLLERLQQVHDNWKPEDWRELLASVASEHGLKYYRSVIKFGETQ